ncbi:hypothetical protein D3C76_1511900 [compost metagenome]
MGQDPPPLLEARQGGTGVLQETLALGSQAQVAGRARQQAHTQLLLQTFERCTGYRRR